MAVSFFLFSDSDIFGRIGANGWEGRLMYSQRFEHRWVPLKEEFNITIETINRGLCWGVERDRGYHRFLTLLHGRSRPI